MGLRDAGASPIIPSGWSKQSFKPGNVVTITDEAVRSRRSVGRLLEAVFADGPALLPSGSTAAAPAGGTRP